MTDYTEYAMIGWLCCGWALKKHLIKEEVMQINLLWCFALTSPRSNPRKRMFISALFHGAFQLPKAGPRWPQLLWQRRVSEGMTPHKHSNFWNALLPWTQCKLPVHQNLLSSVLGYIISIRLYCQGHVLNLTLSPIRYIYTSELHRASGSFGVLLRELVIA